MLAQDHVSEREFAKSVSLLGDCSASACNFPQPSCVLQMIENQPCQVHLDDALLFAQRFNPIHQLPDETVDPLLSRASHQAKMSSSRHANETQKKGKSKQKEKKKRRKRRKSV